MYTYTMQKSKDSKMHVESYHVVPKQINCERRIVERTIKYINAELKIQNYTMQNNKNLRMQSRVKLYHAMPKQTNCDRNKKNVRRESQRELQNA